MLVGFWIYLWGLVRKSFHGALRIVEITEALAAVSIHSLGYYFHDLEDELQVVFVIAESGTGTTFLAVEH